MNYEKIYNQLIEKRQKNVLVKKQKTDIDYMYCESHHINPRSLGGSNDKTNLVNLTAREHFICHLLLVKIFESKYGLYSKQYCSMLYALNLLAGIRNNTKRLNSRCYEIIRKKFSEMQSIKMSGKNNPMYGHSCTENMTNEQYNKWLEAHRGKNHQFYGKKRPEHSKKMSGNKNPMYGKKIKDCMSADKYEQWHNKVKANKYGKQNPFYGKHHTKETIEKIKNANKQYVLKNGGHGASYGIKRTPEQIKRNSEAHKHPYSYERKLKQNMTIIKRCCCNLCDLSEFDFKLYITLSYGEKYKYRMNYIKTHPKKSLT